MCVCVSVRHCFNLLSLFSNKTVLTFSIMIWYLCTVMDHRVDVQ